MFFLTLLNFKWNAIYPATTNFNLIDYVLFYPFSIFCSPFFLLLLFAKVSIVYIIYIRLRSFLLLFSHFSECARAAERNRHKFCTQRELTIWNDRYTWCTGQISLVWAYSCWLNLLNCHSIVFRALFIFIVFLICLFRSNSDQRWNDCAYN